MIILDKFIYSDDSSKFIHKIATDIYFKKAVKLNNDTIEMFEEVDTIPLQVDKLEYSEEINNLIRQKYSLSEELAILRQKDTKPDEYREYYEYAEECKLKIKKIYEFR